MVAKKLQRKHMKKKKNFGAVVVDIKMSIMFQMDKTNNAENTIGDVKLVKKLNKLDNTKTFSNLQKGEYLYYVVIKSENIPELLSSTLKMLKTEITTVPELKEEFFFDTERFEVSGTMEEYFTLDGGEISNENSILIFSTTITGFTQRIKEFIQSL